VTEGSKPLLPQRMKNIVRAPCFGRVGCDRAGASRQVNGTTTPETWEPREDQPPYYATLLDTN